MKKIKIAIILGAIVFLGVLVFGVILAWPHLAKFWTELVAPNKEYFVMGGFALVMLWLSARKWPLAIKIILGIIALSLSSSLAEIKLVELCGQAVYQVIAAAFLAISFVIMLLKKNRRSDDNDAKIDEPAGREPYRNPYTTTPRKRKKTFSETIKGEWDKTIAKIGLTEADNPKKIAVYIAAAIVIGVILMPLIVRLVVPLWNLIIVPGRDFIILGALAAVTIFMVIKIKNIAVKVIVFGLATSLLSLLYGVDVPTLVQDNWFQVLGLIFIFSTLCEVMVRKFRYDEDGDKMKRAALIAAIVLMILSPLSLIKVTEDWGIIMVLAPLAEAMVGCIVALFIMFMDIDEDTSTLTTFTASVCAIGICCVGIFHAASSVVFQLH